MPHSTRLMVKKLLQGISNLQISNYPISIKNISEGKLFRTSFAQAINNWLAEDYTRCRYYQSQEEIQLDLKKNNSLIHSSLWRTGSGTGHNLISMQQTCNAIINIRNIHPNISFFMESTLPESLESLRAIAPANATRDFSTANYFQIFTASSIRPGHPNPGMKREFIPLIQDDTNVNLSNMRTDVAYTLLHDIYTNALNTIRNEQANIANQKQNLLSLAGSIRSNSNVTEKASNSYLSTDYVLAAESYAENIRKLVSSITALQANNKIPDAIQNLLSNLSS